MAPELLILALDFYRHPLRYRHLTEPKQPLPDVFDTLLIDFAAALSPQNIESAALQLGQKPADIEKAARFFIRQVFVLPEADHYRLLGLSRHASEATVRLHYQLLVRLFHPDRPSDEAEFDYSFTARINDAYSTLRDTDSRQRYDAHLTSIDGPVYPQPDARTFFLPSEPIFTPSDDLRSTRAASRTWQVISVGSLIGFGLAVSLLVLPQRIGTAPAIRTTPETNGGITPKPNDLSQETSAGDAQDAETPRVETQRAAAERAEAERAEAQRAEVQRAEAQRAEVQRAEAQRAEIQRAETQRAEAQRAESLRAEAQRAEAQRAEAERAEAQQAQAQRAEIQRMEAQRAEAERAETQRTEALRAKAQRAEAERAEAQRAEAQRAEAQQAKTLRAETQRAEAQRAGAQRGEIQRTEANRLIQRLAGAYQRGDVGGFVNLFTSDAQVNEGRGAAFIRKDYSDFFQQASEQKLDVRQTIWKSTSDGKLIGKSQASVTIREKGASHLRHFGGTLEFELIRSQGELRISKMLYLLHEGI